MGRRRHMHLFEAALLGVVPELFRSTLSEPRPPAPEYVEPPVYTLEDGRKAQARFLVSRGGHWRRNGNGPIFHAVAEDEWVAVCGKQPGRMSAGWSGVTGTISCRKCSKLVKQ